METWSEQCCGKFNIFCTCTHRQDKHTVSPQHYEPSYASLDALQSRTSSRICDTRQEEYRADRRQRQIDRQQPLGEVIVFVIGVGLLKLPKSKRRYSNSKKCVFQKDIRKRINSQFYFILKPDYKRTIVVFFQRETFP